MRPLFASILSVSKRRLLPASSAIVIIIDENWQGPSVRLKKKRSVDEQAH
jgi:hypothetical protein